MLSPHLPKRASVEFILLLVVAQAKFARECGKEERPLAGYLWRDLQIRRRASGTCGEEATAAGEEAATGA